MTEGQMKILQAEIDTLTQERDEARAQRDQAQAELLATMRQRDEAVDALQQARAIVAKYAGAEAEKSTPCSGGGISDSARDGLLAALKRH